MCLKHSTDKELASELNDRINQGKIKFQFTYYYDTDRNQLKLISTENNTLIMDFNSKFGVETSYLYRQIYKNYCEPVKKKIEERQGEIKQKERENEFYEALKTKLKKA